MIYWDERKQNYFEAEDAEEELRDLVDFDAYVDAMNALGISPEVDLD